MFAPDFPSQISSKWNLCYISVCFFLAGWLGKICTVCMHLTLILIIWTREGASSLVCQIFPFENLMLKVCIYIYICGACLLESPAIPDAKRKRLRVKKKIFINNIMPNRFD